MSDWTISVPTPASSGEKYSANINTTEGVKAVVEEVTYPSDTTCHINCVEDENGSTRFSAELKYKYNPNADPVEITFTVFLDGGNKGSDTSDVQDD